MSRPGVPGADIRAAVDQRVRDAGALAVHELGILAGSIRIDVAAVGEVLTGYEIKGAGDNLRRLPGQIAGYSRVCDRAAIAVDVHHFNAAVALVPKWWDVLVPARVDGAVVLRLVHEGAPNPNVDARAVAEMLWHADAIALLHDRDAARGVRSKARALAWDRLATVYTLHEIRAHVREHLHARIRLGLIGNSRRIRQPLRDLATTNPAASRGMNHDHQE